MKRLVIFSSHAICAIRCAFSCALRRIEERRKHRALHHGTRCSAPFITMENSETVYHHEQSNCFSKKPKKSYLYYC